MLLSLRQSSQPGLGTKNKRTRTTALPRCRHRAARVVSGRAMACKGGDAPGACGDGHGLLDLLYERLSSGGRSSLLLAARGREDDPADSG